MSNGTAHKVTQQGGYVNLSSIYNLGENKISQSPHLHMNGFADKKLPEKPVPPEKPVSLMMVNGKADGRYAAFGNNSFLYSHLLGSNGTSNGARAKDPPSYSAATSMLEKSREIQVRNPISPNRLSPVSPVNGMNKISDNYERAVAERLSPQRETGRANRSTLFSKVKTGVVSSKVRKNNARQDDDEDDYARDSDECSI